MTSQLRLLAQTTGAQKTAQKLFPIYLDEHDFFYLGSIFARTFRQTANLKVSAPVGSCRCCCCCCWSHFFFTRGRSKPGKRGETQKDRGCNTPRELPGEKRETLTLRSSDERKDGQKERQTEAEINPFISRTSV